MWKLRFDFLSSIEEDGSDRRGSLWGRFQPEGFCSVHQAPLSFSDKQEDIMTMDDGSGAIIERPKEVLRKRQLATRQVFNTGKGGKAHWWCGMARRSVGKRISQVEKDLCDGDIELF